MRCLILLCLFIAAFIPVRGQKANGNIRPSAGPLGRGPLIKEGKDSINIYLNFQDLWGLDLKDGTFNANFYIVMESNGDHASRLQYLNGEKIKNLYFDSTRKPYYEAWYFSEFRTGINFKDYPLDKQYLDIIIEAGETIDKTLLYALQGESALIGKQHLAGGK